MLIMHRLASLEPAPHDERLDLALTILSAPQVVYTNHTTAMATSTALHRTDHSITKAKRGGCRTCCAWACCSACDGLLRTLNSCTISATACGKGKRGQGQDKRRDRGEQTRSAKQERLSWRGTTSAGYTSDIGARYIFATCDDVGQVASSSRLRLAGR